MGNVSVKSGHKHGRCGHKRSGHKRSGHGRCTRRHGRYGGGLSPLNPTGEASRKSPAGTRKVRAKSQGIGKSVLLKEAYKADAEADKAIKLQKKIKHTIRLSLGATSAAQRSTSASRLHSESEERKRKRNRITGLPK
jgi:hypothetical protein